MAMIERAGYYRKAYTRADGTKVKGSYVPAGMIKDVGLPGKGFKGPGEGIGKLRNYVTRVDTGAATYILKLEKWLAQQEQARQREGELD